jgi:TRAP-type uncharacterized transport system substrate-binding protein
LSIATGGSGGVYQVYGGGLADVLSEELPDSPTQLVLPAHRARSSSA